MVFLRAGMDPCLNLVYSYYTLMVLLHALIVTSLAFFVSALVCYHVPQQVSLLDPVPSPPEISSSGE